MAGQGGRMKVWLSVVLIALLGVSFQVSAGDVQLMAKLNGAPRPSIVGTTTLPEGTKIATDLVCPLMYCKDFWSASSEAVVHDGIFISKPFEKDGAPLPTGRYMINVTVFIEQDPIVLEKLSALGWNRRDVIAFHFDTGPGHQSEAVDVATFTPSKWSSTIRQVPWVHLGETESKSYWYSYGTTDHQSYVVVKVATKGIGDEYNGLSILSGMVTCGPGKHYPQALQHVDILDYNATVGIPVSSQPQLPFGQEMPIERGSALAKIVIASCDALAG
jgi:hypothetical protein